jgi:hypothetical protein
MTLGPGEFVDITWEVDFVEVFLPNSPPEFDSPPEFATQPSRDPLKSDSDGDDDDETDRVGVGMGGELAPHSDREQTLPSDDNGHPGKNSRDSRGSSTCGGKSPG